MTPDEELKMKARVFANDNKKDICNSILKDYPSEREPVSVFMAGSPGAGKTEASRRLIERISHSDKAILRIDTDELRNYFDGYNGANSHLFHEAASTLAEKLHDEALKRKISFVFDSTFSSYEKGKQNIQRSLKRDRLVQIYFVYQDPKQAWKLVQDREMVEGRKITIETFIEKYFASREVVNKIKREFGSLIKVDLIIKNNDHSTRNWEQGVSSIDNHIPETYTRDSLKEVLC